MKPLHVAASALSAMLALAATSALAADPGKDNPLAVPPQVESAGSSSNSSSGATSDSKSSPTPSPAQRAPAAAANASPPAASGKPLSANEAAGLPDLDSINRSPAKNGSASSTVEFSQQREPSFHQKERSGTEITEYRDHAKPTEINVHSNFGTSYQMSPPPDDSPNIPNSGNGPNTGRVPSIHLTY